MGHGVVKQHDLVKECHGWERDRTVPKYLALKREYEAFQAFRIQEQLQDAITCQKHRPCIDPS